MNKYVSQLIEDMQAAHRHEEETAPVGESDDDDDDLEAHFAEVERYLSGEGEQTIAEISGLYAEQFPPAERLNPSQQKRISKAYEQMLLSWNVYVDLPDKLPADLKYTLLTGTLSRSVFVMKEGFVGIELCEYDSDTCPFGEKYCRCKEVWDSMSESEKNTKSDEWEEGELPF